MIRAVLAVLVTTALLAASLPAVDAARRDHTDAVVREQIDGVVRAARTLAATNDPVAGPGARRVVAVHLPARSWVHAGVHALRIAGGTNGSGGRFRWRPTDGHQRTRRVPGLRLRTHHDRSVSVSEPGRHLLALALDGTPARPVVTVQRVGTDPRSDPDQGFKRENGGKSADARMAA